VILHLDTSFVIDLLREQLRGEGPAARFLGDHLDDQLQMSVFVECELFTGVERSERPEEERRKVEAICSAVATVYPGPTFATLYGRSLATLQRSGQAIATMDLLVATTAMMAAAPLVTGNVGHFERVDGLRILSY